MAKKIGGVDLKWWVIGGAGSAIIVWYVYKKQQASAAATAVDTTATDTTDPNLSGYGDYSGAYGGNYQTPSNYGYYDQTTGQFIGLGGTTTVAGPTTNSTWVQAAAAYLINQGYDPITVITALGKYVSSQGLAALTQNEYNIVTAAIGIEGQPPEPIAAPHLEANTGQTPSTTLASLKAKLVATQLQAKVYAANYNAESKAAKSGTAAARKLHQTRANSWNTRLQAAYKTIDTLKQQISAANTA